MKRNWSVLKERSEIQAAVQLEDYLTVDDKVSIGGLLTFDEIAQASKLDTDEIAVESDEEIAEVIEQEPVKGAEARQAFHKLRRYFRENELDPDTESVFERFENLLLKDQMAKLIQPKISDFFAPV